VAHTDEADGWWHFSPDSKWLWVPEKGLIWDTETGQRRSLAPFSNESDNPPSAGSFSPDSRFLIGRVTTMGESASASPWLFSWLPHKPDLHSYVSIIDVHTLTETARIVPSPDTGNIEDSLPQGAPFAAGVNGYGGMGGGVGAPGGGGFFPGGPLL